MSGASPLQEARARLGLSQAGLAAAAGVSRQAVSAIEAGRHRPGVDAALALSAVLGCTVEELFAGAGASTPVLGDELADGAGVVAARVGDRLVHAAADDLLAVGGWPEPNAVLRGGVAEPLPGADLGGIVVVGCDPAIGLASSLLRARGGGHVVAVSGTTADARAALAGGRAHAAVVHGPAERLPRPEGEVVRLHVARWRVGVASLDRARSVEELCAAGAAVVQRPSGASSQRAFLAAVAAAGQAPPPGPRAAGHLEAARRVEEGAPAGVTMEPAAVRRGLAFTPLEEHAVELWVDARWAAHPVVEALAELLGSRALASRLELVGGYDLAGAGTRREARR